MFFTIPFKLEEKIRIASFLWKLDTGTFSVWRENPKSNIHMKRKRKSFIHVTHLKSAKTQTLSSNQIGWNGLKIHVSLEFRARIPYITGT
jgi:hypothetical protein